MFQGNTSVWRFCLKTSLHFDNWLVASNTVMWWFLVLFPPRYHSFSIAWQLDIMKTEFKGGSVTPGFRGCSKWKNLQRCNLSVHIL